MKKVIVISLVALLLNSACVFAQAPYAETKKDFSSAYDSYVRRTMEKIPDIPGIAIVVIKDDKPVFVRAYGLADKEAGTEADVNTLFYIASSTKSFTALAAALLDREGKIKLGDPVTKYAAGINFKNPVREKITIRGKGKQRMMASSAERAKRPSQLSLPVADYVGTYSNEYFGTIEISSKGKELEVRMGNIKIIATAFTEKETIRVEMMPGSGEVIRFSKNSDETIGSLNYASATFIKISR